MKNGIVFFLLFNVIISAFISSPCTFFNRNVIYCDSVLMCFDEFWVVSFLYFRIQFFWERQFQAFFIYCYRFAWLWNAIFIWMKKISFQKKYSMCITVHGLSYCCETFSAIKKKSRAKLVIMLSPFTTKAYKHTSILHT